VSAHEGLCKISIPFHHRIDADLTPSAIWPATTRSICSASSEILTAGHRDALRVAA
jgi:hypothetical protein